MVKKSKKRVGVLLRDCEETLSLKFVLTVHDHLTKAFERTEDPISPPGLRDQALLEMAVSRQDVGFGNIRKYPSACANAASLMYGICNDHPFLNGNKRTALICGIMHLDRNGLVFEDVSRDHLYQLMIDIASHKFSRSDKPDGKYEDPKPNSDKEVAAIEAWLKQRVRKIQHGERVIRYRELWTILHRFNHLIVQKNENTVSIYAERSGFFGMGKRQSKVYSYHNPGDGREVPKGQIKELREHLKLSESDGVDAVSFYDKQKMIDEFILEHRSVLRLLAHA